MRADLLSYLEISSKRDWLWRYKLGKNANLNSQITTKKILSACLVRATKQKIEQISSLTKNSSRQDQIIIAETDPLEFLAAFLAGAIAEANIFLCNPEWQQDEWQQVVNLVRPDLILGQPTIKKTIGNLKPTVKAQPTNLAVQGLIMIPTGGSSGKVKFAMHDWSTLSASVMGFKNYFGCQQIDSFCTLPLYHVSGLMQFMRSFLTAGKLIIYPSKMLQDWQPNIEAEDFFISLVPTQLQRLIEIVPNWLKQFKTVLLGGAPASRSLLNLARQYQISLAPTYGMTETASQIVTLKPEDFLNHNHSSGRVLPHAKITIEPVEKSNEANHNPGLIKIKADSLCRGYYPQLFDKLDLFSTDDLGYFDDRGYLYLVGRHSHKIITGGENVYPAEVEAAILATKLVQDVCVVGVSDRYWGQAVTAVYVPIDSLTNLKAIQAAIKTHLVKYKQPKHWIEVDCLPRNNHGKINYQKITEFLDRLQINQ